MLCGDHLSSQIEPQVVWQASARIQVIQIIDICISKRRMLSEMLDLSTCYFALHTRSCLRQLVQSTRFSNHSCWVFWTSGAGQSVCFLTLLVRFAAWPSMDPGTQQHRYCWGRHAHVEMCSRLDSDKQPTSKHCFGMLQLFTG